MGTWQSTLTNFKYLSSDWKNNCEEERLLGVSMTGIMDNSLTNGKKKGLDVLLTSLKKVAVKENQKVADTIGINSSVTIACVKPSRYCFATCRCIIWDSRKTQPILHWDSESRYRKDPLCQMMVDAGFHHEPDHLKPDHTMVFSFPMKSPKIQFVEKDMSH